MGIHGRCVKTNLDALLTARYVHLDDHALALRRRARGRSRVLGDAELVCVALAQVLLRCDQEAVLAAGGRRPDRAPVPAPVVPVALAPASADPHDQITIYFRC